MNLPGREEIAEIVHALLIRNWTHPEMMADGIAQEIDEDACVIADALLARLRPAWERLQKERDDCSRQAGIYHTQLQEQIRASVANGTDVNALRADLETTINQRDRAVEDLRACAEALMLIRSIAKGDRADDFPNDEAAADGIVDTASAALARPGCRDALK